MSESTVEGTHDHDAYIGLIQKSSVLPRECIDE